MSYDQPRWFPDPRNHGRERLWDGAAWTDLVRDARPPELTPAPTSEAANQPSSAAGPPRFNATEFAQHWQPQVESSRNSLPDSGPLEHKPPSERTSDPNDLLARLLEASLASQQASEQAKASAVESVLLSPPVRWVWQLALLLRFPVLASNVLILPLALMHFGDPVRVGRVGQAGGAGLLGWQAALLVLLADASVGLAWLGAALLPDIALRRYQLRSLAALAASCVLTLVIPVLWIYWDTYF